MDDGWEMSDGVQAKVPIRGQPEGGVSLTGANGRRLGETAAVATAQPRLFNPSHVFQLCFAFSSHTQHLWVTLVLFEIAIALHVHVCASMFSCWRKCSCVLVCMTMSVGGERRVRVCVLVCGWLSSGEEGGGGGVPKW